MEIQDSLAVVMEVIIDITGADNVDEGSRLTNQLSRDVFYSVAQKCNNVTREAIGSALGVDVSVVDNHIKYAKYINISNSVFDALRNECIKQVRIKDKSIMVFDLQAGRNKK
jgi:hypothetical protein